MERKIFNLKVLYVEDEEESRREMSRFLKRRFTKVILASNGREGWESFRDFNPDIVITDLLMPEMGGREMVKEMRKTGSECPVFITSALEDVQTIVQSVDLGIVKYIIKPIKTDELSDALDEAAEKLLRRQNSDLPFGISRKKEIEGELRIGMAALLKGRSGKGPKDVSVFIGADRIEITAQGTLTPLEETLLCRGENRQLVEELRRIFYGVIRAEIRSLVSDALGCPAEVSDISINPGGRKDRISLSYFP